MKNKIIIFITLLFITSNTIAQEKYTIKGNIKNAPDGKISLVSLNEIRQKEVLATTNIMNREFSFKGECDYPQFVYLELENIPQGLELFLEAGEIKINSSYEKGQIAPMDVEGSKYFDIIIKPGIPKIKALMKEALEIFGKAADKSKEELEKLQQGIVKSFMENMDKERIRINKLYHSKDPWQSLLARAYNNRMLYDQLTSMDDIATLEEYIGNHKDINTLKKSLPMRIEAHRLQTMVAVGKNYKDFEVADVNGEMTKFSSVVKKNKIILLDFWASW